MRRTLCIASVLAAVVTILANPHPVRGQAVRLAEELARRLLRQEGRQIETRVLATELAASDAARTEIAEATQEFARRTKAVGGSSRIALERFERLRGVDEGLRAEFQALPPLEQQLAVELAESTQQILSRFPSSEGERVLRLLDSPGLLQTRMYGNAVPDGAAWLTSEEVMSVLRNTPLTADEAASIAKLLHQTGQLQLLDTDQLAKLWQSALRTSNGGAARFWSKYVSGHKEKWLAAGLLATYLAMPAKFHDAVGHLTEYGIKRLTEAGIDVGDAIVSGLQNGVTSAIQDRYRHDPSGMLMRFAIVGLLVIACVSPLRRLAWRTLHGSIGAVMPKKTTDSSDTRVSQGRPAKCRTAGESPVGGSIETSESGFPIRRSTGVQDQ